MMSHRNEYFQGFSFLFLIHNIIQQTHVFACCYSWTLVFLLANIDHSQYSELFSMAEQVMGYVFFKFWKCHNNLFMILLFFLNQAWWLVDLGVSEWIISIVTVLYLDLGHSRQPFNKNVTFGQRLWQMKLIGNGQTYYGMEAKEEFE